MAADEGSGCITEGPDEAQVGASSRRHSAEQETQQQAAADSSSASARQGPPSPVLRRWPWGLGQVFLVLDCSASSRNPGHLHPTMHFALSLGVVPQQREQDVDAPGFAFLVLVSWFNLMVLKLSFSVVIRTLEL